MSVDPSRQSGSSPGAALADPGPVDRPSPRPPSGARPCRFALLGFGTVGQALVRSLVDDPRPELQLTHIVNRDVSRKRVPWTPGTVRWTDDLAEVLDSDVDVIVELIGGVDPAGAWMRAALEAGKSVVTANKQAVAHAGPELAALARARGLEFRFEAAVGGAVPMLGGLRDGLAGDRVRAIVGLLNGTCNAILSCIERTGASFEEALGEARRLGLAEADPSDDLEGRDAAAKLTLLCGVGFGRHADPGGWPCQSIAGIEPVDFIYAGRLGCTIRQVAYAEPADGALAGWVGPALVPASSLLAHVHGSRNILLAAGTAAAQTGFFGVGAGGRPTAVAVLSDLLAIASGARQSCCEPAIPARTRAIEPPRPQRRYVRFVVRDQPGIIATLAAAFAAEEISLEAVLQEPPVRQAELPFVITLDPCPTPALHRALDVIGHCRFHAKPPLSLRMPDDLEDAGA
ncbi:MAG TPA: homoserine dehydrogenase [Vicinamibacterales bacterium]|nr:homoserine dehydrogenase [Vicinamibacterales bacterium]